MLKKLPMQMILTLILVLALLAGSMAVVRWFKGSSVVAPKASGSHSPLFDPGDKTGPVFLKEVDTETGKTLNAAATIHLSKDRSNQMKQTVLAFLEGPRTGRIQVPVPEGLALNELYLTTSGAAVVDLSTAQVKKEQVGLTEEALFIRCLIDTLSGNFFEAKQVKVLVDGQEAPTLFGHYALGTSEASQPVSAVTNPTIQ